MKGGDKGKLYATEVLKEIQSFKCFQSGQEIYENPSTYLEMWIGNKIETSLVLFDWSRRIT